MLYSSDVHLKFWGEAVHTAVYTLNRGGSSTLNEVIPFEFWHKQSFHVGHMCIFGVDTYFHVPRQVRKKLDAKAKTSIFMSYSTTSKAYRIWSNDTK